MPEDRIPNESAENERQAFSGRLLEALAAAGYVQTGATEIARLFNHHCSGKVSSHAVRKWMKWSGSAHSATTAMPC